MKKVLMLFLAISIFSQPLIARASTSDFSYLDNFEKQLTSEMIDEIIEKTKTMSVDEAANYFDEVMKEHTLNYTTVPSGQVHLMSPSYGETDYTVSYSNSGLYTASSTSGNWANIINSTLSLVLGLTTAVGSILYGVANLFYSFIPETSKKAEAKNYYSYRYITYKGLVYTQNTLPTLPATWKVWATDVSRQVYEHGWGYYTDTLGYARQSTIDFPSPKLSQWGPNSNPTAIKSRALAVYNGGIPYPFPDYTSGY